jgi:RNA polymerase-binding protein DksA
MINDIEPAVGNWYQRVDDDTLFQVIAIDEDEELIEFQDFDGDIGEVTLDEWRQWDIEVSDPPEDWTGPVDDVELDDLGYSEIRSEAELRIPEARRSEELQDLDVPAEEDEDVTEDLAEEAPVERVERRTTGRGRPRKQRERERERPARRRPARRTAPPGQRADGLSADQINKVKARLTGRADELRLDIQRELRKYDNESYSQLAERVADPGDQAWADLAVDMNLAEVTRDVAEIREIERALQRLAEGNYGICISCGEHIDPQRVEVNPAAVRCFECQHEHEARSRQTRPSL